jgi:ketosteroid isomerase-like protein
MSEPAERLDRIEARLAIQDIVARYARAVDSRDLDELVSLFVDDIELGDGDRGRAGLAIQFRTTLQSFYRSMHQIVGQVIDLEAPDRAAGTVYCRAEHECGEHWVAVGICYFDRYARRDGDWFFASRQARIFYHADMAHGPRPPYDVWPGRGDPDRRATLPQRWSSWGGFWAEAPEGVIASLTLVPTNDGK